MIPLKYNTASQEIPLGHFLDSANGDSEETGLTIANTDIKLWKSGATTLANKNSGGATHISNGIYYCVLDATDTNTYGPLVVFVHVSGALAVKVTCTVMEANAYDSFYAALGTGSVESNLVQMGASTQSATDLKDFADAGYDPATNKVQGVVLTDTLTTYTSNTPQTGDAYGVVNSGTFGNAQLVRSTTPANTLDINVTGEAGIDLDNTSGTLAKTTDITGFNDIAATDIVSAGAITTLTGAVVNVDSVDTVSTCTTNTDMRGTDNALLASAAPTNFGDLAITVTTGETTVGTNNDKTGYSISGTKNVLDDLNDIAATAIVSGGAINTTTGAVDTVTDITNAVTVGTINANVITATSINAAALTAAKFAAGAVDANALATDAVDEIRDAILPTQNAAFSNIGFLFVAASDHVTPVTGATGMAVTRSIDGGSFSSGTGTGPAEIGNGIYQYDASAADMNGGVITFRFTATGGTPGAPDDRFLTIVTGGGV